MIQVTPVAFCRACDRRLIPLEAWRVHGECICTNCARLAAAHGLAEYARAMGGDGGPGGWSYFLPSEGRWAARSK